MGVAATFCLADGPGHPATTGHSHSTQAQRWFRWTLHRDRSPCRV